MSAIGFARSSARHSTRTRTLTSSRPLEAMAYACTTRSDSPYRLSAHGENVAYCVPKSLQGMGVLPRALPQLFSRRAPEDSPAGSKGSSLPTAAAPCSFLCPIWPHRTRFGQGRTSCCHCGNGKQVFPRLQAMHVTGVRKHRCQAMALPDCAPVWTTALRHTPRTAVRTPTSHLLPPASAC